jgi:hypothetical protein
MGIIGRLVGPTQAPPRSMCNAAPTEAHTAAASPGPNTLLTTGPISGRGGESIDQSSLSLQRTFIEPRISERCESRRPTIRS